MATYLGSLVLSALVLFSLFEKSVNSCLRHPADTKGICLDKPVPCEIPNCLWCQKEQCMECEEGMFLNYKLGKCLPCVEGCLSCLSDSPSECLRLKPGYDRSLTMQIVKCEFENCAICEYDSWILRGEHIYELHKTTIHPYQCTECFPGSRAIRSLEGNGRSVSCQKCEVENCMDCPDDTNVCTSCFAGFYLDHQKCVKNTTETCKNRDYFGRCRDCPEKQVFSDVEQKCVYCPSNCADCHRPGRCVSCKTGYYLKRDTEVCVPCEIDGCFSCLDGPTKCDTCAPGFYFDMLRKKCMLCHRTCGTCNGPYETDCKLCKGTRKPQQIKFHKLDPNIYKQILTSYRSKFPDVMAQEFYMGKNFHPWDENYCLDKCRNSDDYPSRTEEIYDPVTRGECQTMEVLHHLMITKHGGTFDPYTQQDKDTAEQMEARRMEDKRKVKEQQRDILDRERQDLEETEGYGAQEDSYYNKPPSNTSGDL